MNISLSSNINISADGAWNLVKQSSTLLYVTRGLLGFRPVYSSLPVEWREGQIEKVTIMLFGFIPAWEHEIYFKEISDTKMIQLTQESGGVVNTWVHKIGIKTVDKNTCKYTDELEIDAGVFTPIIYLYAHVFYRYRQLRWKFLVKINRG